MSQPITVSVTMDAASFRRFRWFDLLQHNRIWKRPLVFTAILLVFAGVCLTQLNTRHEAGLLAGVLALVSIGTIFENRDKQNQQPTMIAMISLLVSFMPCLPRRPTFLREFSTPLATMPSPARN